jgi:hypothetical protein
MGIATSESASGGTSSAPRLGLSRGLKQTIARRSRSARDGGVVGGRAAVRGHAEVAVVGHRELLGILPQCCSGRALDGVEARSTGESLRGAPEREDC